MIKRMLLFCALALLAGCTASVEPGTQVAVNPLTYTDIPDNDIIRVGDDYYMVSTTMFYCPGAPIMHSRDLVHWRIVNYIYDVLEDDDIYNLRNEMAAYGKGQWATSLRYHKGTYYALFVANDQHKTYLYKTRDIEKGPWKRNEIEGFFMHDASLLFDDDDRLWVIWGNGDLHLAELEPDGSGVKAGAGEKIVISSPREGWGLRAEGAHFYHIGDYYYVLEIDWPAGQVRTATCWRSKRIEGPYESKVVLQGTLGGRQDGIAQGPIIDTQFGDWYAIQFQDHGAIGRIPTIQRVTWMDGWPIMGDNGVPEEQVTVNLKADGEDYVWDSDEFNASSLALVWQWNHKEPAGWSLTERKGWLKLTPDGTCYGLPDALGTLTQRTVGPRCISEVLLDLKDLQPGDEAGICAFQSRSARLGVEISQSGGRMLTLREKEDILSRVAIDQDLLWLRIRYVFTPVEEGDVPDTAFFSWSTDGENWTDINYALEMRFTLDYFTGYRTGLYCFNRSGKGGSAWFDWFRQRVY
ncbi:MAG: glycoside hydrolase 43 family protein [Bacteroidales bacterium]|nr:glycoside hydrolase 43 family protein [Bacteroidales bacterium]